VIWPDASSAQNSIAAVSAEGSTVWVLMRRLNSSCVTAHLPLGGLAPTTAAAGLTDERRFDSPHL